MSVIQPGGMSRWTQVLRRGRDAAEFGSHIPRNSPVSSVVHTLMGFGGAAAVTVGGAALLADKPDPANPGAWDRDSWLHSSRAGVTAAGAMTVLITAGMQFATPQHTPLARGVNPLYFLGVGAFAWGNFCLPKIQQAYAE
jgi:hypothetical protein